MVNLLHILAAACKETLHIYYHFFQLFGKCSFPVLAQIDGCQLLQIDWVSVASNCTTDISTTPASCIPRYLNDVIDFNEPVFYDNIILIYTRYISVHVCCHMQIYCVIANKQCIFGSWNSISC